ncbi:hypothetical protein B0H10DRAFT_2208070 [Mycena sp. CBHHK59/15]|nr:hypothetical protein B0H10DRAFT_2208070 [Mycena sp. CBHHK59/15]
MDLQFSGEHEKVELSAANFMKKLNMLHHTNKMPEAKKFIDVADRFEEDSPAEKWFNTLQATVPLPAAASDWAAFQVAFRARFKGAPPMLKPRAQLEAELSRMQISVGTLAAGMVELCEHQVYVLADFERLTDAVVAADAAATAVRLWDFHMVLPPVLQDAVGAMPANWLAMRTALGAVPQSKIALAVTKYKEKKSTKADVEDLKKLFGSLHVAPSSTRPPNSSPTPNPPVVDAPATPAALKGHKGNATAEQKEQLRKVLEACIARRHPNTPVGLTEYMVDIHTWERKFGAIVRNVLKLELTNYPLTPGVDNPCTGECWSCGVRMSPPHEKTPEGQDVAWTHQSPAAAVNQVAVEPTVVMGPWYDGEREEMRNGEDFGKGLQDKLEVVELYTLGSMRDETNPFLHWVVLEGPRGEKVWVLALWDGGALVGAMDKDVFKKARNCLGNISTPTKTLRMANGVLVDSLVHWEGTLKIDGVRASRAFEIFNSKGGWSLLFSKPLQAAFGVVHDMKADIVTLSAGGHTALLRNQHPDAVEGRRKERDAAKAARHAASTGSHGYIFS